MSSESTHTECGSTLAQLAQDDERIDRTYDIMMPIQQNVPFGQTHTTSDARFRRSLIKTVTLLAARDACSNWCREAAALTEKQRRCFALLAAFAKQRRCFAERAPSSGGTEEADGEEPGVRGRPE